jgi:hypothetical protein
MMVKLRLTSGAQEFILSLAYETYVSDAGVIEVPDDTAAWAIGQGLYEIVKPEPESKPRRNRATDAPPAVEEEG